MTFDPALPLAPEGFAQSQIDITTNFNQSNIIFGQDHVNFNNATVVDRGKHTHIMSKRDAFAVALPVTAVDEGAIYTKEAAGAGRVEAYYRYPSNGPIMQLSFIKAWCRFNGTLASPIAIADGYNVTNITVLAATHYQVNFTTALTNANYGLFVLTNNSGLAIRIGGQAVGSCDFWAQGTIIDVLIVGT